MTLMLLVFGYFIAFVLGFALGALLRAGRSEDD